MTLALPKKHRTTRSNTRRRTVFRYLGIALSCVMLGVSTTGGSFGQDQTSESIFDVQTPRDSRQSRELSPVDRLKSRSPSHRWNRLNKSYGQPKPSNSNAPATVATPPTRPVDLGEAIGVFQPTQTQIERTQDSKWKTASPASTVELVDDEEEFSDDLQMPEQFSNSEIEQEFNDPEIANQNQFNDFEEPAEFPQPSARNEVEDEIYREIEEEFPRIQITASDLPETVEMPQQPGVRPLPRTAVLAQNPLGGNNRGPNVMGELIASPKDLKPLSRIQPFFDYEPNPEVRENDPYLNIYPRPDAGDEKPPETTLAYPEVVGLGDDVYQPRDIAHVDYPWLASDLYHRPLYFEDVDFERSGHTHHELIQPFASVGKFGLQLIGLPYQMALQPIGQRQYALGWNRPGEFSPYRYYQVPWNTDAAVRTGIFYTGMTFAFP